jgi:hypothetical protein
LEKEKWFETNENVSNGTQRSWIAWKTLRWWQKLADVECKLAGMQFQDRNEAGQWMGVALRVCV